MLQWSSVLRLMHWADSKVWGESFELHPVEIESEWQGEWGGFWREVIKAENVHVCNSYLLSPHSDSKTTKHLFGTQQLYFSALRVGVGFFNSSSSSAFCFPPRELYSLKASAWKASHRSQRNPNLKKSNENVKRCPSGTGKSLPLASSSLVWRAVYSYGACGCVLLFGVTHVSIPFFFFDILTSSAKPQNRLFFSGRDVWLWLCCCCTLKTGPGWRPYRGDKYNYNVAKYLTFKTSLYFDVYASECGG